MRIILLRGLCLHIGQHKQDKHIQTSLYQVGLEPSTPGFQRTKAVHALDRAATFNSTFKTLS